MPGVATINRVWRADTKHDEIGRGFLRYADESAPGITHLESKRPSRRREQQSAALVANGAKQRRGFATFRSLTLLETVSPG
jgi:hypothetical protein